MDISMAEVIGAVAVMFATVITVLIEKLRRDNNRDHGIVRDILKDIHGDVEDVKGDMKDVRSRLNDHIDWHMDREETAPKKRGRPRKKTD